MHLIRMIADVLISIDCYMATIVPATTQIMMFAQAIAAEEHVTMNDLHPGGLPCV